MIPWRRSEIPGVLFLLLIFAFRITVVILTHHTHALSYHVPLRVHSQRIQRARSRAWVQDGTPKGHRYGASFRIQLFRVERDVEEGF